MGQPTTTVKETHDSSQGPEDGVQQELSQTEPGRLEHMLGLFGESLGLGFCGFGHQDHNKFLECMKRASAQQESWTRVVQVLCRAEPGK